MWISQSRAGWAPWWAYAVAIGVPNLARQLVYPPGDHSTSANVAVFAASVVVMSVLVTVGYRLSRPSA